jgi:imidazolonepropionase-like amidohydrolase
MVVHPVLLVLGLLQPPAAPARRPLREVNTVPRPPATHLVAIVGGTLIDGRGGAPIENAAVVIRGDRIVAAGRRAAVAVPPAATVVDAAGLTVLPGLIDAHFHLDGDHGLPALFLRHGITSVRDPGAWIEVYDTVRASAGPLPRFFLAGPHLDQPPPAYPDDAFLVRDAEETRAAVDRFIDQGASVIKVYFRLPPSLIAVATQTAHRRGVPVTAHLETVDAATAIAAGIDGLEHVTSLGPALLPPREAERYRRSVVADNNARRDGRYRIFSQLHLEGEPTARLLALLARRGVVLSPTLAVFERRGGDTGVDESQVRGFRQMMALTGMAKRAGVRVVVGSHSSVPHAERGWAYQREMELLVEAGLTPMEAIVAATMENARFFRIADRLGGVEVGKVADLVLVRGRPDQDIGAMRRISRVMINGGWLD